MISADTSVLTNLHSPVRSIAARVELYSGSTLQNTFKHNDRLISFEVQRVGVGKFFGYGICHRLNLKLIDTNRELNITTKNILNVIFESGSVETNAFPLFYVTEVHRDEVTNELSITAYDRLYEAVTHFYSDLVVSPPYDLKTLVTAIGSFLGLSVDFVYTDSSFDVVYDAGGNFEGSENLREVLDAIAEATQTIYFINYNNKLVFKALNGREPYSIDKSRYFDLEIGTNRRLSTITHVTELGDNLSASFGLSGSTQYVRNNPFWETREDIADLLESAITTIGGLVINQFECSWRGNYLVELGDQLVLTTKDNKMAFAFLLDDTLTYDGTLHQKSKWSYEDNDTETESTPITIGESIKQTYAKVDKVNKEISLVVSEAGANAATLSALTANTEAIDAYVKTVENNFNDSLNTVNADIQTLTEQAGLSITSEDVQIAITTELEKGVDKVTTTTGFTFNDEGLRVSKSDSEISTQITEDGMQVSRGENVVLTANNEGVQAEDLHATTYLIVGSNSRFEDYTNISNEARTGCFWIGG